MEEIWKDVKDYEGLYKISNLGRFKSFRRGACKVLSGSLNKDGYRQHTLQIAKGLKYNVFGAHQLVAMAFLNHIPNGNNGLTVDHIDSDVSNNCISNLQLLTGRENSVKHTSSRISSSKYTGVSWHNHNSKWMATIYVNKTKKYLGSYTKEIDAHLAYKKALKEIAPLNE
jgi:hypothetical protein